MRRGFSGWVLAAVLSTSVVAFGADPLPPPPPPPPAEEVGSSGGSAFKQTNALLDRSSGHQRKQMLSFFLGFPYSGYGYGGGFGFGIGGFPLGIGARYYIPIVAEGFIPPVNDSFGIEFGADLNFIFFGGGTGFAFSIPAEARWNFHLLPNLEAYAKLGFGIGFWTTQTFFVYAYPISQVGIIFHVTETISLRAEVGYPWVKVGLGIAF